MSIKKESDALCSQIWVTKSITLLSQSPQAHITRRHPLRYLDCSFCTVAFVIRELCRKIRSRGQKWTKRLGDFGHQRTNYSSGNLRTTPPFVQIESHPRLRAISESQQYGSVRCLIPNQWLVLNPQIHHAVVLEKEMRCGVRVRVQRDGTFLFDFSAWSPAPQIEIPGYRILNPERSHRTPSASDDASRRSEEYAVLRAQVMNVHQSCLATSEQRLKRRSGLMGFPIRVSSPLRGLTFDDAISYQNAVNDVHALARNVLNNKDKISRSRPYPRHPLELEVVDHSLNLFDQILLAKDTALIQMIEATYLAACRVSEGRSGEAITLAWTVCEQLLSTAWETLLNDMKNDKERAGRMPSSRKEKLEGRDYTASVKTEMLEINRRINHDLYLHLETARKARNTWAHNMREPETHEVYKAIRAVEGLLRQIKGIQPIPSVERPANRRT